MSSLKLPGQGREHVSTGSPLFLRYRRRQIPTALGRKVLEYAEKIVDEQNRMMLTMRSVTGREKQNNIQKSIKKKPKKYLKN